MQRVKIHTPTAAAITIACCWGKRDSSPKEQSEHRNFGIEEFLKIDYINAIDIDTNIDTITTTTFIAIAKFAVIIETLKYQE